jgi:hypothetical protein
MDELFTRFWHDLVDRIGGPFTLRLVLQPIVASTLALRAGLRDAREGQPPYLWTVFTDHKLRWDLIAEGCRDIVKVFIVAIVLDSLYQVKVFGWLYPQETVLVALVLAVMPYAAIRGPANRIAQLLRRWT